MRDLISVTAPLILAAMLSVSFGQEQGDGVRRITPAEAREAVAQGRAIIVDVRSQASYNSGHIQGARWIQLDDIGARARSLPRDKMIITYCS
jgi:rhodanese-related sulfurtransferase